MQRSPYVSLMFPLMCLLPVAAAGCSASSARTAEIRQVVLSGDDADRRFEALRAVFPYGEVTVNLHHGGLDVPRPEGEGNPTVMANVALSVGFDMEPADD